MRVAAHIAMGVLGFLFIGALFIGAAVASTCGLNGVC